ncbi:MAG: hypothetical protein H0T61_05600 [Actinobacteria bacterium]|nr:hypothetical protein [Actinomycetota bacterium]
MDERYEEAARLYQTAAHELEQAAAHCRTAAGHFTDGEVPRAAAHAWAARGHVLEAQQSLDEQAREHARRSTP